MKVMESRGQTISLIDEVRKVSYDSRADLAPLFPAGQDTPILWGHNSHPHFNLYKVRGPAEITKRGIFVKAVGNHQRAQVGWGQWPEPGDSREPKLYPPHDIEDRRIALVTKCMNPAEVYMVIGTGDCKKQLEQWRISSLGIEGLL